MARSGPPALEHELKDYLDRLYRDAQARGSDLIIGILRYDFARDQYRNSVVAVNGTLTWYDKRRLVPFGEFFPDAGFRAQMDAAHEPAVCRHDSRRPGATAAWSRPARNSERLSAMKTPTAASGSRCSGGDTARQREQRCVVR